MKMAENNGVELIIERKALKINSWLTYWLLSLPGILHAQKEPT